MTSPAPRSACSATQRKACSPLPGPATNTVPRAPPGSTHSVTLSTRADGSSTERTSPTGGRTRYSGGVSRITLPARAAQAAPDQSRR
uniref:Uncharacterized protein n=1 Tax=uncultured Armatimonadetes bacterium TaxID=157466 RepID=A0A6J4JL47_9BACT|nr:hypothetical protein AVDCRST_MAG63-3579 [uncultured Armatimonadetes bacterium]